MQSKEKTFERILVDYQDKIYRLCWSYIQNEDDRKDLLQNILIKIWKNLESFNEKSSLSTWIYRLSVNTSIDYMRQSKKHNHLSTNTNISNLNVVDNSNNVEEYFVLSENLKLLHKCINQLSFIDKTLTNLYLENLKYREIAEIIGISEKNVSVKLYRIKKLLRKYFKDLEE